MEAASKHGKKCAGLAVVLVFAVGIAVAAPFSSVLRNGGALEWTPSESVTEAALRVTGPGGYVFEKRFVGVKPSLPFSLSGTSMADGQYNFELIWLKPIPAALINALEKSAMRPDGATEDSGLSTKIGAFSRSESGTFRVAAGVVHLPGPSIEQPRRDSLAAVTAKDQVIPDDLIVQGSACFGFDCVNNESFGFDTIRLKENNLRIKFEDTSATAGFPSNDWQLTANDSASGGASKFSIDDVTGSTTPFTVTAGAPTNSIFVDSSGRLGLRTATPVLDVHVATSNTPALRLEQNSSGGFTAQTWDVAGNEANFFVRDVTSGSRLPFRIRPGAPTSSIDISASGNVGVGTASPWVAAGFTNVSINNSTNGGMLSFLQNGTARAHLYNSAGTGQLNIQAAAAVSFTNGATSRLYVNHTNGNVGIGTTSPASQLHSTGTVRFAGLTSCVSGIVTNASGDLSCLISSARFKNIVGELPPAKAMANIMALKPHVGSYRDNPGVTEHWLIAEEVAKVDSALVGTKDQEPYTVKLQAIITNLISVVQQQQRKIDALEKAITK